MRAKYLALALTVALLFLLAAAFPVVAQQGINDMWNAVLMHSTLRVQGAVVHDSTLTQTGGASFSGAVTATSTVSVTGLVKHVPQVKVMAANGNGAAQTVTPTSNTIVISPSAAVTVALGLVANGTIIAITNDTSNNVLFPDSGNQLLGGARTVVSNDTLTLMQVGGKWHELAFVAN